VDGGDGSYTFTVTSHLPGSHVLSVMVEGEHYPNTVEVAFHSPLVGDADAALESLRYAVALLRVAVERLLRLFGLLV
jgi:hypothetical protein